jgi:hypothetical protein
MCTSSISRGRQVRVAGFTALELLIGLTLTVLLALAVAPLSLSLQTTGVREADRTVVLLQGRAAAGRFERDLRLATAGGSPFWAGGPILQATPWQVVFLGRAGDGAVLNILEWEIGADCIMRRWGRCPTVKPLTFAHALYVDHKSMLDGIAPYGAFSYLVNGKVLAGTVPESSLVSIEAVILRAKGHDSAGDWPLGLWTTARVGR